MVIIGYLWALPVTVIGLSIAVLSPLTGGSIHCRNGVVEAWGGFPGRLLVGGKWFRGGAAMTLGHVIIARNADCLVRSRSHELQHVRQFERWGLFLLPVYWSIAVWLRCRGFDSYLDHPLEPLPR